MPPDPSPEITKSDMVRLPASQETSDDQPLGPATSPTNLESVPGYRLGEKMGRGGMGVVYRARDLALDRDVAVKVLQDRFAPNSSTAQRFVEEAQITGQLQHPGIPAVYAVAKLPDGRPYLAMKLIKGDTLADLLRTKTPVNTLAVFEAIAQAVGYAHAHNVIHRDLKPANVMVGAFGEVQVMDWGLAKVLSETPSLSSSSLDPEVTTAGTQIRSIRDSDTPLTQYGTAMGTPAYMAPEQAAGEIHKIDKRTDVFGLGALLCTLLTGQPPYLGDGDSVRLKALRGQTEDAFARLDSCGAEPEVTALCKQCLHFDSEARPRDANNVAERIAALRRAADDRAKQAELAQARAEVQTAEQRKRRVVLLYSAVTVFVVLTAGITVSLWQAIRATNAEKDTADQLVKTEEARQEAVTNEQRANTRTRELLDSYNQMVFGIQSKLETRPGTQSLRKELLQIARVGLKKILDEARKHGEPDSTLVWSHFRMGDVELNLGNTAAALKEFQAAHDMANQLVQIHPDKAEAIEDLGVSYDNLGNVLLQHGQSKQALESYQNAEALWQQLAETDRNNTRIQHARCINYDRLGGVLRVLGKWKEALDYYQKSLAIREQHVKRDRSDVEALRSLSISYSNLADVMEKLGKTVEAVQQYQKGFAYLKLIADAKPNDIQAQRDLSVSYTKLGDIMLERRQLKDALNYHQKGLAIAERLAGIDINNSQAQYDLSVSYERLGDLMDKMGQTKQAMSYYRKGLEITERLANKDSKNSQAQRGLSMSYNRLGDVMLQQGQVDEALEMFRKEIAVRERRVESDRNNLQAQRDLGVSYHHFGHVMYQMQQTKTALEYYQKGLKIREHLAEANVNNHEIQRDLSVNYSDLGLVMLRLGQTKQALEYVQKGLAITLRLSKADLTNAQAQRDLAITYHKLGDVLVQLERPEEALKQYQNGSAIFQRQAEDLKNAEAQSDLALSYERQGDLLMKLRQNKKALELFEKTLVINRRLIETDRQNAQYQRSLSVVYWKMAMVHEQEFEFIKAAEWYNQAEKLATAFSKPGFYPGDLPWIRSRLSICNNAEKVIADIEVAFKQPVQQVPQLLSLRARVLLQRNKPTEAIATAERFVEWADKLEKNRPLHLYNAACVFALCASGVEKERDKLIEQTLALLRKAKESGFFNSRSIAHLKQNSAFNSIRNDAKFAAFIKEFEAGKK